MITACQRNNFGGKIYNISVYIIFFNNSLSKMDADPDIDLAFRRHFYIVFSKCLLDFYGGFNGFFRI